MDEGPVAMTGMDAQLSPDRVTRTSAVRWLWMLGTAAAVVAACVAIRLLGVPQAAAQAPVVRAGSPTAPPRPGVTAQPAPQRPTAQPAGPQAPPPTAGVPTR